MLIRDTLNALIEARETHKPFNPLIKNRITSGTLVKEMTVLAMMILVEEYEHIIGEIRDHEY